MASILIVEDNPANLKLATMLLVKAGHGVSQAVDGEAGVRLAQETRPDLVLLDIQMPGIDGLEAIRRLRSNPATAQLKIIAVTALAMKGDEERIRAAGCDGYIAKPFHYREFLEQVKAALAK
ncbi:MAG: response regulator [Sulfuritalea sp.]|nr:response regulator [Sulfuritalea sp.]